MNRYIFREAVGAYFHVDTGAVRGWLPAGLVPLEARPGHAIFAVTSFDFVDSEAGPYREVVLSVLLPPHAGRDVELPYAATFPIVLLTNTDASAAHNSERWLLPGYERSVDIQFVRDGKLRGIDVRDRGEPLLSLRVERRGGSPASRLCQVFTTKDGRLNRANVRFLGDFDDHQDETGRLDLAAGHPLAQRLGGALLDEVPIMEQSMDAGEEQYHDPVPHRPEAS